MGRPGMGFCATVVALHVLTVAGFVGGIVYVYIIPRMSAADPDFSAGLGGVTHNTARLWLRMRGAATVRVAGTGAAADGAVISVAAPTHASRTLVVPLRNLRPDTQHTLTVAVDGDARHTFEATFRTLAAPGVALGEDFAFLFGSCLMQRNWPFDRVALFDALLSAAPRPLFAMLIGDSIYTDAPFKLSPDRAYRQLIGDASFRNLTASVPVMFQFDDHEIHNDADDSASEPFREYVAVYDSYLGTRNPVTVPGQRYFSFWHGPVAFLVLDTRSHRSRTATVDGAGKTMLGSQQLDYVRRWAHETRGASVRFVVSPVPVSASVQRGDGWAAFSHERTVLLDMMAGAARTVFLSGDVHFAYAMELRPGMYEVSASPISSVPMHAKLASPLVAGERLVFRSQLKQHMGRVTVRRDGRVVVALYSEIPVPLVDTVTLQHELVL